MILSEEEALKLWCPEAQQGKAQRLSITCIGSKCAVWTWANVSTVEGEIVENAGYCGKIVNLPK
jgi:hypothetical protein